MAGNKPTNKSNETQDRQLAGVKMPPHSLEAEQSVLGGLMLDNERWDNVSERVWQMIFSIARTVLFSLRCSVCWKTANLST